MPVISFHSLVVEASEKMRNQSATVETFASYCHEPALRDGRDESHFSCYREWKGHGACGTTVCPPVSIANEEVEDDFCEV
jgi:hypothetical protein